MNKKEETKERTWDRGLNSIYVTLSKRKANKANMILLRLIGHLISIFAEIYIRPCSIYLLSREISVSLRGWRYHKSPCFGARNAVGDVDALRG